MEIRLARRDEVRELTACSKAAFETDVACGNAGGGGPPGYASRQWHERMRQSGSLYVIEEHAELIGGAVLFREEKAANVLQIGRIFIRPQQHRKGYGTEAMRKIESLFPEVCVWRLSTPAWNDRTNRFYPKLGYRETGRDGELVCYQKERE